MMPAKPDDELEASIWPYGVPEDPEEYGIPKLIDMEGKESWLQHENLNETQAT